MAEARTADGTTYTLSLPRPLRQRPPEVLPPNVFTFLGTVTSGVSPIHSLIHSFIHSVDTDVHVAPGSGPGGNRTGPLDSRGSGLAQALCPAV